MKTRIIYILCCLFVSASCSNEFLEVPQTGATNPANLASEEGIDLLLTGAYSVMTGAVGKELPPNGAFASSPDNWIFDAMSDDAHKGSEDTDQPSLLDMEIYNLSPANNYIGAKFIILYSGVNRANNVISTIELVSGVDLSEKEAEARFLRAYFYFEITKIFGRASIITPQNTAENNFNQPNTDMAWDEIESDLQFAIDNLPETNEEGRPTSWAAKALLGKAHVFQSDWSTALPLLQDVIDNGPYSLAIEFVDNFTIVGENGPESVFAVQFTTEGPQGANGNNGGVLNFPLGAESVFPGNCCGFYQPTIDLSNAYKTDGSGLPLLDTFNESDIANDYNIASSVTFTPETGPLDPRIDYTIGRRGIEFNGYGINPGKDWIRALPETHLSGPYLAKKNVWQSSEESSAVASGPWGQKVSGINYNVIRYADVLLLAAEAAVETNNLSLGLDYVNQVRNRAKNMTPVMNESGTVPAANYEIEPYSSFSDVDHARKAVRFERRLELAMEGHRYFDLTRWGIAKKVLDEYVVNETRVIENFGDKMRVYKEDYKFMPIPINAIDLAGVDQNGSPVLNQNPGY